MKTPMQELIDEMQKSPVMFASALTLIEQMRMLKKEKEAMCEFAERYLDSIPKEHPSVEDVYNETFNTISLNPTKW